MHKRIILQKPDYFSFEACLDFLNRGYAECLYHVEDKSVKRLIRLESGLSIIKVADNNNELLIDIDKDNISTLDLIEIESYIIDWFDLKRDLYEFYKLLENQTLTESFSSEFYGLRLMGIVDIFEALCWCVIGQQINLSFAHKIKTRLVHKYGDCVTHNGEKYYCFPTPSQLISCDRDELVAMKFSKQKINYIANLSNVFYSGELSKQKLLKLEADEQMKRLTSIKGIGPWTANYVSMKTLGNMRCIAYGDTGLSSALHTVFSTDKKPTNAKIDEIFKQFRPWESYFNFYLWKSLS